MLYAHALSFFISLPTLPPPLCGADFSKSAELFTGKGRRREGGRGAVPSSSSFFPSFVGAMRSEHHVVALVNRRSGGRRAADYVFAKLKAEFGEERVFSLFHGPDPSRYTPDAKSFLAFHQPDVVIVAGGDGTISFGMDVIKELHDELKLESTKGVVAPFPLGTGNDLSYTLGYGGGFARWVVLGAPRFCSTMHRFQHSKAIQLDRWYLSVSVASPPGSKRLLAKKVMNNYFSVGFDAAVAQQLDGFRRRYPQYFLTRPIVKLWYAFFAAKALFTEKPIADSVTVTLDGRRLPLPLNTKALVVANMITYAGGSILWGPNNKTERSLYQAPSLTDGKLEVAALSGVWHLAFVRLGLCYATKLGQGERVEVISSLRNSHQYDGEPMVFPESLGENETGESAALHLDIRYFCNSDVLQARLPQRHLLSVCFASVVVILAVFTAFYVALHSR